MPTPDSIAAWTNSPGIGRSRSSAFPSRTGAEEILGVLELLEQAHRRVSRRRTRRCLSLLATQIGIAMANAQIYDGLRTSLDRLSRLMKVGAAISSELDLDALLRTISQTTSHLLQAERSTVFVVDPVKNELWSRVAEGLGNKEIRIPSAPGSRAWWPPPETRCGSATRTRIRASIPKWTRRPATRRAASCASRCGTVGGR